MHHEECEKLLPFNKFICHAQVLTMPTLFPFEKEYENGRDKTSQIEHGIEFEAKIHYRWKQYKPFKISDSITLPVQVFRRQTVEFAKNHLTANRFVLITDAILGILRPHAHQIENRMGLILDERKGELILITK